MIEFNEFYNDRLDIIKKIITEIESLKQDIKTLEDKAVWSINIAEVLLKLLYTFNIDRELYREMGLGKHINFSFKEFTTNDINTCYNKIDSFLETFKKTIYSFKEVLPGEEV